jgi:hypothetical protein
LGEEDRKLSREKKAVQIVILVKRIGNYKEKKEATQIVI